MLRLTTLARVKRVLNIDSTEADTLLNQLITQISGRIERYLGRHAERTARTVQLDVEWGQQIFFLKGFPVAASPAAAFRNDSAREFSGDDIDTSNYHLRLGEGSVSFDLRAMIPGPGALRAVYTGGMAYTFDRLQLTVGSPTDDWDVGATVTGAQSGATGTVVSWTTPTLVLTVDDTGAFLIGEAITPSVGGGTGTVSSLDRLPLILGFPEVVQAAEWQTAFEYQRKTSIGGTSISMEGASISIEAATQFLPGVKEMLAPVRSRVGRSEF